MSEPFIAEIRIFAGNFAPRGWSFCDGQLLPISQNTALFSLVGTTYGGDGRTDFGIPNLQGRAPMHTGRGPGLTQRRDGESGGVETVTLTAAQTPNHSHTLQGTQTVGQDNDPQSDSLPAGSVGGALYASADAATPTVAMSDEALPPAVGGDQAHNNVQPFLALNFIIALVGLYPSRS